MLRFLFTLIMLFESTACAPAQQDSTLETATPNLINSTITVNSSHSCKLALDDGVSPSYKPDAPKRTVVGHGHIVTGVVLSSVDCRPIANAKLEFWPEEEGPGHLDSARATFFTDLEGRYRFECNLPEHIHMRISAPGYRTIGVNSYHPEGRPEGTLDVVLEPEQ